jgi:hypothetical protein
MEFVGNLKCISSEYSDLFNFFADPTVLSILGEMIEIFGYQINSQFSLILHLVNVRMLSKKKKLKEMKVLLW